MTDVVRASYALCAQNCSGTPRPRRGLREVCARPLPPPKLSGTWERRTWSLWVKASPPSWHSYSKASRAAPERTAVREQTLSGGVAGRGRGSWSGTSGHSWMRGVVRGPIGVGSTEIGARVRCDSQRRGATSGCFEGGTQAQ